MTELKDAREAQEAQTRELKAQIQLLNEKIDTLLKVYPSLPKVSILFRSKVFRKENYQRMQDVSLLFQVQKDMMEQDRLLDAAQFTEEFGREIVRQLKDKPLQRGLRLCLVKNHIESEDQLLDWLKKS